MKLKNKKFPQLNIILTPTKDPHLWVIEYNDIIIGHFFMESSSFELVKNYNTMPYNDTVTNHLEEARQTLQEEY